MSTLVIAAALWVASQKLPQFPPPPAPTVGVPRGEVPKNVRPWRGPVTTPATSPAPCPPPVPKR